MHSLTSILLVALSVSFVAASDKVQVELYYESLCPGCNQFITEHLAPSWENVSSIMNLTLIPFGHATIQKYDNGEVRFTCQHGPNECRGNLIHNCALQQSKGDLTKSMPFIDCMEKEIRQYPNAQINAIAKSCADFTKFYTYEALNECASGAEGTRLLIAAGQRTKLLNPKYVPALLINGNNNEQALTYFTKSVCKAYRGQNAPKVCKQFNQIKLN